MENCNLPNYREIRHFCGFQKMKLCLESENRTDIRIIVKGKTLKPNSIQPHSMGFRKLRLPILIPYRSSVTALDVTVDWSRTLKNKNACRVETSSGLEVVR